MPNDINYNEIFGLTEEEGVKEQEVAEPAQDETEDEGVKEQEVAESAEEGDVTPAEEPAAESGSEEPAEEGEKGQSAEDNAAFAAARRKAEREKAAAIEAEREKFNRLIADAGFVNPFDNTPVQDMEQLQKYAAAAREEQLKAIRTKSGMTEEEFDSVVKNLPEVKEAEALAQQMKEERARQKMEEHLAEITKLDPKIRTVEDLSKDPKFPEIREKVRQFHIPVSDAYRLVYHDEIVRKAAERAQVSARQHTASKSHLTKTAEPRGKTDAVVPQDVAEMYRLFDPNITDEEIRKDYNERKKKRNV